MREKDFVELLWKYFELHSNQRMQMMNFYLIVESLFITGLIAMVNAKKDLTIYEIGTCIAIIFFSWVFHKFDMRTRNMIKNCEEAIKSIERKYESTFGVEIMVFIQEESKTRLSKELTYTKLMNIQFVFFVIIALVSLMIIA